jgi:hypothetical protein
LQGAHFWRANLREVNLTAANLTDAILHEANLDGVRCNEETVFPDGAAWTPATDMKRFTDPNHPKAWQRDYKPGVLVEVTPWAVDDPKAPFPD